MRRPLAALLAATGVVAAAVLRGRRRRAAVEQSVPVPDPRAMELRRKLAESRTLVGERDEFEAGETPIDRAEDVEDKRRVVHEHGRAAADEMRRHEHGDGARSGPNPSG